MAGQTPPLSRTQPPLAPSGVDGPRRRPGAPERWQGEGGRRGGEGEGHRSGLRTATLPPPRKPVGNPRARQTHRGGRYHLFPPGRPQPQGADARPPLPPFPPRGYPPRLLPLAAGGGRNSRKGDCRGERKAEPTPGAGQSPRVFKPPRRNALDTCNGTAHPRRDGGNQHRPDSTNEHGSRRLAAETVSPPDTHRADAGTQDAHLRRTPGDRGPSSVRTWLTKRGRRTTGERGRSPNRLGEGRSGNRSRSPRQGKPLLSPKPNHPSTSRVDGPRRRPGAPATSAGRGRRGGEGEGHRAGLTTATLPLPLRNPSGTPEPAKRTGKAGSGGGRYHLFPPPPARTQPQGADARPPLPPFPPRGYPPRLLPLAARGGRNSWKGDCRGERKAEPTPPGRDSPPGSLNLCARMR
ncbi:basic salivary proline-rich protein 4-like [Dromiciops gliroides]|uniref:basic salivary proline-rich protein 4-like n=1 Tax=Dromiciops gliroides TaxID=33562 RepID=UPI001CC40F63|nr:basic salivary proline-rich protein 4-like [Dromiciops gliroides]